MNKSYLLKVENLHTRFFTERGVVKAVNGISFGMRKGEIIGIVGESGSGKSITVRSIMRIVFPPGEITEGRVLFTGKDLLSLPEREMVHIRGREISMIFQEPSAALNPVLTVGEQIAEVLTTHQGIRKKVARQRSVEHLREVGIPAPEDRYHDYPHQLSGGMQQRCMIAIAVACHPTLLIADEPTTSLDVTIQAQILSLLTSLTHEKGIGLIFITHDIAAVAQIADRIMVMYAGKIVEEGQCAQVIDRPNHPYTIELLRSMPTLKAVKGERLLEIKGEVPDLVNLPPGCPFHPRCSKVIEKCITQVPGLKKIHKGCSVSCWLYG